ncbi:IS3 family transposase [Egicoccus halophilus]|uniref:IS3 family transposase n=3 Tax=Egicoccus halophilus TaxID=1670830 RepID=UPI003B836703
MAARKAEGFNVNAACAAAGVSRSAFYAWLERGEGPTEAEWDEARLINEIRDLHAASDGTYGEPRMTAELVEKGWVLNRKRTARLMRQERLQGHRPRRRRSLTKADEAAPAIEDLVGRRFQPQLLDTVWAGDITYVRTGQGWLYLATVIDLASRRLIGWSMGDRHDATLVVDALEMAVAARGRRKMDGTIFHHDRGSEYTSETFRTACRDLGVTQSCGRTGSCLDNAVAESFFATLKVELIHRLHLPTRAAARRAIFVWVHRYNHRRRHSTIGMIPPALYEQHQRQTQSLPSTVAAYAGVRPAGGKSTGHWIPTGWLVSLRDGSGRLRTRSVGCR